MKFGFINVNKPGGASSATIVNTIKRLTNTPCGHMGTLDPLADGVLPVAVGNAARLFEYMLRKKKQYIATFRFGAYSETLDSEGEVSVRNPYVPTREELESVLPALTGEVEQIPPKYSAKSINGKRGYKLARAGKEFTLPPKTVTIDRIELIDQPREDEYRFVIDCGSGTYIRSIARDLAAACGTDGIMTALTRTRSGEFYLKDAVKIETLTAENIEDYITETENVLDLPTLPVPDEHIFHGLAQPTPAADGLYKIYDGNGFYGLAEVKECRAKIKTKLC